MKDYLPEGSPAPSRRQFIRLGAMLTAASRLDVNAFAQEAHPTPSRSMINTPFAATKTPRIGFIGVGGRGTSLLGWFLAQNAQVVAICDVVQAKAEHAGQMTVKAGQKAPQLYTQGPHDYEALTARNDLDLVVIATPWDWHTPMALSAMENGKHAAVEVPLAYTMEDLWHLVETSESTRRHCIMLEECCYGYNETLVLNLVRHGVLGQLLYGEAAYLHDLREEMFSSQGEGLWRRAFHTQSNGNLYPTHGLGPVANYMSINRGDRFDYMVSMSTPALGLAAYRAGHVPKGDPKWSENYTTGDMNTSLIKTASGLAITLKFDTSNAHPYDRINMVGGTKGVFADYPPRIYIDGQPGKEAWNSIDEYKKDYESPLWAQKGEMARTSGGHGGMDFIMIYRLLQCLREGLAPDMDVYDGAAWSAPGPMSKMSLELGSAPVKFPDFTRGLWNKRSGSSI
ncbi:Gfo/Idh/MocA family protein [Acidipila rosea]|uniref:Putative dehydrogenase n=1 Tax=Acidipila rosea TaxID=768535 RepID=A0A4R1LG72_9BACT|nr:Gfo/Idh/MocA family oxidoreductase [Acidipila rosea]TCK75853.1 putative dehydrogenase [Acidipila rosea]